MQEERKIDDTGLEWIAQMFKEGSPKVKVNEEKMNLLDQNPEEVMDGNPTLPQKAVEVENDAELVGEGAADDPAQGRAPKRRGPARPVHKG